MASKKEARQISKPFTETTTFENVEVESQKELVTNRSDFLSNFYEKITHFGILLALISCLFYVTNSLMIKLTPRFNGIIMLTIRFFFQTLVYGISILSQKRSFFSDKFSNIWLLIRGFTAYASAIALYTALRQIPLSEAVTISTTAPVFTCIFGFLLFGDSLILFHALCLTLVLVGWIMIGRPQSILQLITERTTNLFLIQWKNDSASSGNFIILSSQQLQGAAFALCSAFLFAFCLVSLKKLRHVPVTVILFWFSFANLLCGSIHLTFLHVFKGDPSVRLPKGSEWFCTLGSCFAGFSGQLLANIGMKIDKTGLLPLGRSGDILFGFVIQALILHEESLQVTSMIGALVIFIAVAMFAINRWTSSGLVHGNWIKILKPKNDCNYRGGCDEKHKREQKMKSNISDSVVHVMNL